jgi:hypothetical protein
MGIKVYQSLKFTFRFVSNIHSIIVVFIYFKVLMNNYQELLDDPFRYTSLDARILLYITTGYLITDFLISLFFGDSTGLVEIILHHLIGAFSLYLSSVSFTFYFKVTGKTQFITLYFILTEASTPFVNFRWYCFFLLRYYLF